jgi:hypothetical protein
LESDVPSIIQFNRFRSSLTTPTSPTAKENRTQN